MAGIKKKLKLPDGSIYHGTVLGNHKHGKGKLLFPDSSSYDGEWVNDEKQGEGEFEYKDESTYKGGWMKDKYHGYGILTFRTGAYYNGVWAQGHKNGKGKQLFHNGDLYDGTYLDDKPHGYGRMIYANGQEYDGEWVEGRKEGSGKEKYKSNNEYFGEFKNNERNGKGKLVYYFGEQKMGGYHTGYWLNGLKHGPGFEYYIDPTRKEEAIQRLGPITPFKYEGYFLCGKKNFIGRVTYLDESYEECQFEDGKRAGEGLWINLEKEEWKHILYQNDEPVGRIESQLENPPNDRVPYFVLLGCLMKSHMQWSDIQFQPLSTSLYTYNESKTKFARELEELVEWKRLGETAPNIQLFSNKFPEHPITMGKLEAGNFYGVINALLNYPERIKRIFVQDKFVNTTGCLGVCFNKFGVKQQILIDDFFPLYKDEIAPIFAYTSANEFWLLALEKAMGKEMGSYSMIPKIKTEEVLEYLLGCPIHIIGNVEESQKEYILKDLNYVMEKEWLIIVQTHRKPLDDPHIPNIYEVVGISQTDVILLRRNKMSDRGGQRVPTLHHSPTAAASQGGASQQNKKNFKRAMSIINDAQEGHEILELAEKKEKSNEEYGSTNKELEKEFLEVSDMRDIDKIYICYDRGGYIHSTARHLIECTPQMNYYYSYYEIKVATLTHLFISVHHPTELIDQEGGNTFFVLAKDLTGKKDFEYVKGKGQKKGGSASTLELFLDNGTYWMCVEYELPNEHTIPTQLEIVNIFSEQRVSIRQFGYWTHLDFFNKVYKSAATKYATPSEIGGGELVMYKYFVKDNGVQIIFFHNYVRKRWKYSNTYICTNMAFACQKPIGELNEKCKLDINEEIVPDGELVIILKQVYADKYSLNIGQGTVTMITQASLGSTPRHAS